MAVGEAVRIVRETRTVRRLRRRGGAILPFVPYGLLPILGLALLLGFGLVPFAFASIQRDTARTASQALADIGATWATASASGQWVHIGGAPPSKQAADQAVAAVRSARAMTLFGAAVPATRVITHFVDVNPAAPAAVTPAPAQPVPVQPAPTTPAPVIATPEPPAAAPAPAAPAASPATPSCDQTFAALLARSRIEFSTGSALIGPENNALLDDIAKAAIACPGDLVIAGHTDNVGRAAFNTGLSRRRAEAVGLALAQRGVPASRVTAEGVGDGRPIADNVTEAGRARNRRIEIRMSPPT